MDTSFIVLERFLYSQWHTIFADMNHGKLHYADICNFTFDMNYWAVRVCKELNVRRNQREYLRTWNKPDQRWEDS